MDSTQILILVVVFVVFGTILAGLAYFLLKGSRSSSAPIRDLMLTGKSTDVFAKEEGMRDQSGQIVDEIKEKTGSARTGTKQEDISTKLFKAGFFSSAERRRFLQFRIVTFVVACVAVPAAMWAFFESYQLTASGLVLGVIIGYSFPMTWLERQIRSREEDILYYLPLAIEQVSIGVSSALDVGPCISHIVQMAYERESHNPVTEMFVHVEKLIRSGLNLEDAIVEVGDASGMSEVKHAFMFLAQCSRHGGEVTRQLQELADAVMVQRQVNIEGKITSLPVKATGPLAMVFAGFFALLFAGLVVRLMSVFGDSG